MDDPEINTPETPIEWEAFFRVMQILPDTAIYLSGNTSVKKALELAREVINQEWDDLSRRQHPGSMKELFSLTQHLMGFLEGYVNTGLKEQGYSCSASLARYAVRVAFIDECYLEAVLPLGNCTTN